MMNEAGAVPARDCLGPGGETLARDDWKHYDEDLWEDEGEEETKASPEKQCARCLHFVAREATYCTWCGKVFDER